MSAPAKDIWHLEAPPALAPAPRVIPSFVGRQLVQAGALGLIAIVGLLADDWIASVAVIALFLGWKLFASEKGPPVIATAFSAQWIQVMAAVIYFAFTGRAIYQMRTSDYRPMVLIGLAGVVLLFLGFLFGSGLRRHRIAREIGVRQALPFTTYQIAVAYFVAVAVSGMLQRFAWSASGLTQFILVFSRVRYVLLFFLITRLCKPYPRFFAIGGILLLEVALGFTGFFAEFREPLLIGAIALFGSLDRRKVSTWIMISGLAFLAIGSAVLWTAIKPIIRKSYAYNSSRIERLNSAMSVATNTFVPGESNLAARGDTLVTRLWQVYWPALALKRVPSVVPYENGAILKGAIDNVIRPRMFNPDKEAIPSPSDEVRKYSGVWVHGRESNTSIAFGYVGESYVDYGLPWMFVPIFIYGLLLGFSYRWLTRRIKHVELRTGATIVIFWFMLGSYETSWVMMIGPAITILAVLGGAALALDKYLLASKTAVAARVSAAPLSYRRSPTMRLVR